MKSIRYFNDFPVFSLSITNLYYDLLYSYNEFILSEGAPMRFLLLFSILFSFSFSETSMVKDPRSNLLWEDTSHVKETKLTQPKAEKYCNELILGDFTDWRLPTIKELLTIVDYSRIEPALLKEFSYVEDESFYWSKTVVADESDAFWGVNFKRGASSKASEYYDRYVRCVRDVK
jgi:hypothetical protein